MVNRYKYLGVTLTPQWKFTDHLNEKLSLAKFWIMIFELKILIFIRKNEITLQAKFSVFNSVFKSLIAYGAQIWVFGLPKLTQNYIVYLETGRDPLILHNLKFHFDYILKVLSLPDHRLPKILAQEVISKNICWWKACLPLFRNR